MECIPRENAAPYIQWIYSLFGSCVYGYQDAISTLLGYASIFCWLNAQVPQVMENYKLRSADGLSLYLLYFWLAGDLGNMFSCVLNHQLPFQTYLAIYFVGTDLILLYQYFHFGKGDLLYSEEAALKINNGITNDQSNDEESTLLLTEPLELIKTIEDVCPSSHTACTYGSTDNKRKPTTLFMGLILFGCRLGFGSALTTTATGAADNSNNVNMISMLTNTDYASVVTFGWLLAWMCTTFYLVSRIPQIYKNYKRHSTQGLSLALFNFAVCGNLTYAASILLHPGHTRRTFLESLPYLAGSVGTLFLDAIIFGQFVHYKRQNNVRNIATILSRVPTTQ